MNWSTVQTFITNNTKYVVGIATIVFAVMAYSNVVTKFSEADATVRRMQEGFNVQLNENAKKVELLGQQLGDTKTYIASTKYLTDPNFFVKLFSSDARTQKRMYDSVMALIPDVVRKEFDRVKEKPKEIGVTNVVIDSVLIEVKVGNSVRFARGSLTYKPDSNAYALHLYKDVIEITDVRGDVHEDGFLLQTVTARSKLTGQVFDVTTSRNFVNWEKSPWDWRPAAFLFVGPSWHYDGGRAPDLTAGIEWIKLKGSSWEWTVFRGEITPIGMTLRTGLIYKF